MTLFVLMLGQFTVCQGPAPPGKPTAIPSVVVEGHVISIGKFGIFPGAPKGPKGPTHMLNLELVVDPKDPNSTRLFQLSGKIKVVDGSGKNIDVNVFQSGLQQRSDVPHRKVQRLMFPVAVTPEMKLRSISGVLLLADAIHHDFIFNANQFVPNTVVEIGGKRCKLTMFDQDDGELFVEFKTSFERLDDFAMPARPNRDDFSFRGGMAPTMLRVAYANGRTATPPARGGHTHSNGGRTISSTRFQVSTTAGQPTKLTIRFSEISGATTRVPFTLEDIRVPEPRPVAPPKKQNFGPIAGVAFDSVLK